MGMIRVCDRCSKPFEKKVGVQETGYAVKVFDREYEVCHSCLADVRACMTAPAPSPPPPTYTRDDDLEPYSRPGRGATGPLPPPELSHAGRFVRALAVRS